MQSTLCAPSGHNSALVLNWLFLNYYSNFLKDIFRRYPNKYESVIGTLCECLESLDEPEAKASMIWIIGEYCARIENAAELLESFLEAFHDENHQVQSFYLLEY